jgi:hypothetical protein
MSTEAVKYYVGRPEAIVQVNFSLAREAAELLAAMAPTRKARGAYISRLLLEERCRQEERAKLKAELASLLS